MEKLIIIYLSIFLIGSFLGWITEVVYRSVRNKKFINPGFLTGCALPIYGFGILFITIIYQIDFTFISNYYIEIIIKGVICGITATLFELICGVVAMKYAKMRLWDYSNEPLNYKGYICLKFVIVWCVASFLYMITLCDIVYNIAEIIVNNPLFIAILGMCYGIFIVDLCSSFNLSVKIKDYANRIKDIVNLDVIREKTRKHIKEKFGKKHLFTLRINAHINNFIDEIIKRNEK